MTKRTKNDYEVGYAKPPKAHQFKPGQSGNPSGRPKKQKGLIDHARKELSRKIEVTENGRRKRYPVDQLLVRKTITEGLKGGTREREAALALMRLRDTEARLESGDPLSKKAREELDKAAFDAFTAFQQLSSDSDEEGE